MAKIIVVGSGASGVHFALSLLRKNYAVTMIDVGHDRPSPVAPTSNFSTLKERLDDPAAYFLGSRYEGVFLPDFEGEYYGIPPSKDYVLQRPPDFRYTPHGFNPLFSFARGGLAEAWTAGCYPLNDGELIDFPFSYTDLEPHYNEVARRIGISGVEDDLARFMPVHENLLPPLKLDPHSKRLLESYERHRVEMNKDLGCYLGRTRVAALSRDLGSRKACEYLGRCLWGCPIDAFYTPSQTLRLCMAHQGFTYIPDMRVKYFRFNSADRIIAVVAHSVDGGEVREFPVDRLVLAAGTLCSSEIFLRSVYEATGEVLRLQGLMDNRQVLLPFVNVRMIGQAFPADSYQYHLLGMGIDATPRCGYVHCQITTLKTALMHPLIQRLPFDLRTSTFFMRMLHAALGLVNLNFHDTRRKENYLTLSREAGRSPLSLAIHYAPPDDEPVRLRAAIRKTEKALWKLGCIVPPGMAHVRPMGASVHYAGTLPMSREAAPWTTTEYCQSREFQNLYVIDGTTFPFLPSKNPTFTLMANAVRVAEAAF